MTDLEYSVYFDELLKRVNETKELDEEIFGAIFEAKIKPIVRNVFMPVARSFVYFDVEDVANDIFIKLWSKSVVGYFMNDKYEKNAAWFLGWCKIVVKHHVDSLFRNRANLGVDPIDDPDHPVNVQVYDEEYKKLILREVIKQLCSKVICLSSKTEMKLTWLAVYLPVYAGDVVDKIESNHRYIDKYGSGTLDGLADGVLQIGRAHV